MGEELKPGDEWVEEKRFRIRFGPRMCPLVPGGSCFAAECEFWVEDAARCSIYVIASALQTPRQIAKVKSRLKELAEYEMSLDEGGEV